MTKHSYTMTSISLGETHEESMRLVEYWFSKYKELENKITENGKHRLTEEDACSGCNKKLKIEWVKE